MVCFKASTQYKNAAPDKNKVGVKVGLRQSQTGNGNVKQGAATRISRLQGEKQDDT